MLTRYTLLELKKGESCKISEYGNPTNKLPTYNRVCLFSISRGISVESTPKWRDIFFVKLKNCKNSTIIIS